MSLPALTGGESVYCINELQMRKALQLAREDPRSAPLLAGKLAELEAQLDRNERAALAFLLIERLRRAPDR
jgi:hypothetical protein